MWCLGYLQHHASRLMFVAAGKYIFVQYPYVARAMAMLAPLQLVYFSIPFLPFIIFLAVYSGIVNNQSLVGVMKVSRQPGVEAEKQFITKQQQQQQQPRSSSQVGPPPPTCQHTNSNTPTAGAPVLPGM